MSEQQRTIWCGNLAPEVTDEVVYELFLQAGPLERVSRPRDSQRSGAPRSYAFIVYEHEQSVPYAVRLFEGTELFGKPLRLQMQGSQSPADGKSGGNSDKSWLGWGHRYDERAPNSPRSHHHPPTANSDHHQAPSRYDMAPVHAHVQQQQQWVSAMQQYMYPPAAVGYLAAAAVNDIYFNHQQYRQQQRQQYARAEMMHRYAAGYRR